MTKDRKSTASTASQKVAKTEFNKETGVYYDIEVNYDEFEEFHKIVIGVELLLDMSAEYSESEPYQTELVAEMLSDRARKLYDLLAQRFDQVKAAKEGGAA